MNCKLYWGLAALLILIISATVFLVIRNQAEIRQLEREAAEAQKLLQQRNAPQVPQGEHPPHPHFHEDGSFHEGAPEDPIATDPQVQYTAPEGAVTKPDFPKVDPNEDPVKAAYKRLEYIKNNPYAWGGVHSERATELIAELMPARLAADHDEGDERSLLIYELCQQGDPRVAEALIAHMCDGGVGWVVMDDALAEIGPPAVPHILPYLERADTKGSDWIYINWEVFDSLTRIGKRYRDDLGGIVDHIIIPKFKEIAADENNERYGRSTVIRARKALAKFQ
ncbi:hypothetical protein C6501_10540 [Candidatus Poribacteria bacterium]|nr:MAG: hypothetical protein C6501_10540 [Candidatus Poribacteria bacterium]